MDAHSNSNKISLSIGLLLIVLMCVACGGGYDSAPSPPSPSNNSAPVFVTASNLTLQENITVVTTIAAGDAENSELFFNVVEGADADLFMIDSWTGELRFRAPPDFEAPLDSNENNTYVVMLTVSDGELTRRQIFAVSVLDHTLTVEVPTGYVKTLKFHWPLVKGVTHYDLLVSPDGVSDYIQVDRGITATHASVTLPVHLTDWNNSRYVVEGYSDQEVVFRSDSAEIRDVMLASIGYIKASNANALDYFGKGVALSADGQTLVVGAPGESSAATGVDGDGQKDNSASDAGAVYVYARVGNEWVQQAYLKASKTDARDAFGDSVALSADGQTVVVGARGEDSAATGVDGDGQEDNSASGAGAVYVYARVGNEWVQQAYLKASNTDAGDAFGDSVVLSGDGQTVVVGARGENSAVTGVDGDGQEDNSASEAGAVYAYTRTGTEWRQQSYLKASNTDAGDYFGASLALSADGQSLAVGAWGENSAVLGIDGDQEDTGAVYLYTYMGGVWVEQTYLKASNPEASDVFGISVALSADGQSLVVGAPGEDSAASGMNGNQLDNAADRAGAVYMYTRAGTGWTQQVYLKASNTDARDNFGVNVALSADAQTLAVGGSGEESAIAGINGGQQNNAAPSAGAVYLF